MHNSSCERRRVPFLRNAFYRFKKKKKVRKRVLTSPGINHISLCRPTVLLIEQKDGLLTSSSDRVQRHCGHVDAGWHASVPLRRFVQPLNCNSFFSVLFKLKKKLHVYFYFPLSLLTEFPSCILITSSHSTWTLNFYKSQAYYPISSQPPPWNKKAREWSIWTRRLRSLRLGQPRN